MAKTYRITIEYTALDDLDNPPQYWQWGDLLDIDPSRETYHCDVERIPTNEVQVQEIMAENILADSI